MVSMKTLPKMTMTCDTSPSVCDDVYVYVCVSTSAQQRSRGLHCCLFRPRAHPRSKPNTSRTHIILVVDTQREKEVRKLLFTRKRERGVCVFFLCVEQVEDG